MERESHTPKVKMYENYSFPDRKCQHETDITDTLAIRASVPLALAAVLASLVRDVIVAILWLSAQPCITAPERSRNQSLRSLTAALF